MGTSETTASAERPEWLDLAPWVALSRSASPETVRSALAAALPGVREFAALLSAAASPFLEDMAQKAQGLTRRHFGRTISLYAPLYLSNYCVGGCAYCGFAADRRQVRRRLEKDELSAELRALKAGGIQDVLLLTGERCPEADFAYLRESVAEAARHFHTVAVESFAMTSEEYRTLFEAGCTAVTLYQETYDLALYDRLHRWGAKRDYVFRLHAPERALEAGMRWLGLGVLLGLGDPVADAIALYLHARRLQKAFWRGGVQISFPRLCPEQGRYHPDAVVDDRRLVQLICAFRIALPEIPLALSTRERPALRDAMAGVGISRMSVASRTTVGGYAPGAAETGGQFDVSDQRDVQAFCAALRGKGLEPVFKSWDSILDRAGDGR
jgi:2-iminoacetate synthase